MIRRRSCGPSIRLGSPVDGPAPSRTGPWNTASKVTGQPTSAFDQAALTDPHRQFLNQCAHVPVDTAQLVRLGPVASTKWSDLRLDELKLNFERWSVLDLDFLELSIRVKPKSDEDATVFESRATSRQSELDALILRLGLRLSNDTNNKTRRVLNALASALG